MTSAPLMKPVRVIKELNPTDLFIRALDHEAELRAARHARADALYVEGIEQARARYLAPRVTDTLAANGVPDAPPVPA